MCAWVASRSLIPVSAAQSQSNTVKFIIMPSCSKCTELRKSIANTPVVSGAGSYPSTLELGYMVNLEYYININVSCIHEIPENGNAEIKIKEMVDFLDSRKWQLGTRTSYNGKNIVTHLTDVIRGKTAVSQDSSARHS